MKIKCALNEGVVRLALVAFNFVFSVLSIALIALGVVYIEGVWWPSNYASLNFIKLPVLLIILGALSFLTSLAGCYCSKSNNKRYLIIFIICLIVLLAIELTVAFIAFTNVGGGMENNTRSIVKHEFLDKDTSNKKKFHALESYYDCCGVDGVKDYNIILHQEYCCQDVCGWDILITTDVQTKEGCSLVVVNKIKRVSLEAGCFTMVVALIDVLEVSCLFYIAMQYE